MGAEATPAATSAATSVATSAVSGWFDPDEDSVLELTNRVRRAHGCSRRLRYNDDLAYAAYRHSRDMARRRYFSHQSRDRRHPDDRIHRAGYNPRNGWGENIAYGYRSAYSVVDAWMNSPSHRRNILNCEFRSLGVGVAVAGDGTLFWTQDFGGR
ncbi:CAP domain-containing protein [Luedemannella flava]